MHDALMTAARSEPPSQWWCLRSQLNGKFITTGLDLEEDHFDFVGPIVLHFDQEDAERDAAKHRETFPALLIEAVPLPATPPRVVRPKRHNDGEPVAAILHVTRADEHVWIEFRPETMSTRGTLLTLLQLTVELAAERIAGARVSPLRLITLGPISAQVELRPTNGTSTTEAA